MNTAFPNQQQLSELPEWATLAELARATGITGHRLRTNLKGVKTIKLGPFQQNGFLFYVPDVAKFLNSRVEVMK